MNIVIDLIISFFYQIIYRSIVATIIGVVILNLKKVTRKRLSPNANYIISLVFLVALIIPVSLPSAISIYNCFDISKVEFSSDNKLYTMADLMKEANNNSKRQEDSIEYIVDGHSKIWNRHMRTIISLIWFLVFILVLIKKMFSYIKSSKSRGKEEIKDERVLLIFERCKEKSKVKRNIKILKDNSLKSPATTGIFRVKILLTDEFLKLNDMLLTNIFMHELAHYKRKDNVVNFLILIIKSIYWFHPMMEVIVENIRNEMEFATDQIAIDGMNLEELRSYCKLMVDMPSMNKQAVEHMLGLSANTRKIGKRIEMISLKEDFKKNSVVIFIVTFFIIILMCFVFYPTSYGISEVPKLYLKLENGELVEVKEEENIAEIRLSEGSEINLVVKNGKPDEYIFYHRVNLNTMESGQNVYNISRNKISCLESGEYIYKFILSYGRNKNINYAIKVVVE